MSGYTKTTIIDCARSQSEEAKANNHSNPAQWTNQTGTGLHLKVGDQITVHSSYISELGCQTGEIQIKGQKLGDTTAEITEFEELLRNEDLPEKYTLINASNKTVPIEIRDDTLNIVVSPYKTTNGENYMFLPRRYGIRTGSSADWDIFDVREEGSGTPGFGATPGTDIGATRNPQRPLARCSDDWTTIQRPYLTASNNLSHKIAQKNDGKRFTIFTRPQTFHGDITTPTITITGKATDESAVISLTHGAVSDDILVGMVITSESPTTTGLVGSSVLSKTATTITMSTNATDNSNSHQQFTFQFTSSTEDTYLPPVQNASLSANQAQALRDPAIFGGDFLQVRNLLSVKVNPGYNSPTDIAVQLTEELNQRSDIEYLRYKTVNTSGNAEEEVVFSMISETPTYKHYHCATANNYQSNYFTEWFKTDGSWNVDEAYHHLGCYQFIGVKRPELLVTGQKLNGSEGLPIIGSASGTEFINAFDKVLMTKHPWTEENLLKWKEFFDAQVIYPELFDDFEQSGISISVDDTRFFHMNLYDESKTNLQPDPYENANASFSISRAEHPVPALGYDLYNAAVSASHTSFPIFVDYNINCSNKKHDEVGYTNYGGDVGTNQHYPENRMTTDYNDLAYGFARKVSRDTKDGLEFYIGFQFTRTNDKIPDHFLQHNASSLVADGSQSNQQIGTGKGRRYGFDRHFTAYGNAMMLLFNGNVNQVGDDRDDKSLKKYQFAQKESEKAYYLDNYQFGLYLGADAPLFNYDTDQSRFTLSYLHTPEKVGNRWNAGSESVFPNIPSNPNKDDDCYKLNKRLLETNYTPEMNPYSDEFKATMTGGSAASFISKNANIDDYAVMDTHSGLFVEDWLCPEDLWNDSLAGIMGFRYGQFHNPNSTNSRQVRIKAHGANADLNNVNVITTNADVNEGDIIEYEKNIYSENIFSITNPVGRSSGKFATVKYRARQITPPITISPCESVLITAERLPTKTLRPYYTIRSDILLDNNYLGGNKSGITLPIVSITNKANPYGDFLNGQGEITFTNTIDRVLTNIRCSIHEPDGSFARVDLDSAVIFKIDQQMNAQLDIISELLASKAAKDRKEAMAIEEAGPSGLPV